MSTETVRLLSPEIVLVAVALVVFLGGALTRAQKAWSYLAAAGIVAAAIALVAQRGVTATGGPLAIDPTACYVRWSALAAGALLVLMTFRPLSAPGASGYVGSLLVAIAGLMLVSVAGEFVSLLVGLEMVSVATCTSLYFGRQDAQRQESLVKYFLFSALSSAMFLYGLAFLYGSTGSTEFDAIRTALCRPDGPSGAFGPMVKMSLVLIFAGLGLKIAAVPFHFWAPDVYQGTTHANAALLSVVPKAAGLVALVRVVVMAMPTPPETAPYAWRIAAVVAVLTMTFANLMALWQDNLRRLLAYASIAQTGYLLIALAAALAVGGTHAAWDGVAASLFYLVVYAVAIIGTFAALDYLGSRQRQIDAVEELAGLARTRPLLAAALGVFLLSLAGMPPLAGFWGKLVVLASVIGVGAAPVPDAMSHWFLALAVASVLNAVIAAAYCLRIVAVMYFRTPLGTPKAQGSMGTWITVTACAVLTIAIGLYPGRAIKLQSPATPFDARSVAGSADAD